MVQNVRTWLIIQIFSEICIAFGFVIGLFPLAYLWSAQWVIPFAILSFAIAIVTKNQTKVFTILNMVIAILSFIPIIGIVFRIAGTILSVLNLRKLMNVSRI